MKKWEIEWIEYHCIVTIQLSLFITDKWSRAFWSKCCSVHGEDTRADIGSHPVDAIQQLFPSDSTAGLDLPVVSLDCRQCESLITKQFKNNQANIKGMLYYNIFLIMIGPVQHLHMFFNINLIRIVLRTLETVIWHSVTTFQPSCFPVLHIL